MKYWITLLLALLVSGIAQADRTHPTITEKVTWVIEVEYADDFKMSWSIPISAAGWRSCFTSITVIDANGRELAYSNSNSFVMANGWTTAGGEFYISRAEHARVSSARYGLTCK